MIDGEEERKGVLVFFVMGVNNARRTHQEDAVICIHTLCVCVCVCVCV